MSQRLTMRFAAIADLERTAAMLKASDPIGAARCMSKAARLRSTAMDRPARVREKGKDATD
jgi:hypothetical protein